MLKKINRIATPHITDPGKISTPLFNLKIGANNSSISRFAFVISKKIDKRATVRNSLKRKFSSCVEEIFDRIETGNDYIFYPSPQAILAPREKILDEIKKVLIKND